MEIVVLSKGDLPQGVREKITELISSNDGKFRAASVPVPSKKVLKRPLNLIYRQLGNMQLQQRKASGLGFIAGQHSKPRMWLLIAGSTFL